jgi:hypothetical protein
MSDWRGARSGWDSDVGAIGVVNVALVLARVVGQFNVVRPRNGDANQQRILPDCLGCL